MMKIIGACFMSSGLTVILMLFLLSFDSGERCETIVAQERAGYQIVVETQSSLLQRKLDRLDEEIRRVAILQAAQKGLQQELAGHLASKVGTIDDVMAIPVSTLQTEVSYEIKPGGKVVIYGKDKNGCLVYETNNQRRTTCQNGYKETDEITTLAARLTPMEAAAKEEVKQHGGWINVPWLKEQLWKGAAMAYGRVK